MQHLSIFGACLCFVCLACKTSPTRIRELLGPVQQQFTINIGEDTLIRCKGGTVLRFCPNTFVTEQKKITLQVQEVRSRGEAFLLGISTVATDGRLLETEGMLYLNAVSAGNRPVTINPDCPVRVEMPTNGRRPETKWFGGTISGQDVVWNEAPGGFDNQHTINTLADGKTLFNRLCETCHCSDLKTLDTGPALGHVSQFRDKTWLQKFTRKSQAFIASGDSIALCVWNAYKPVVMPDFPNLSDAEIDAIYQFIQEESGRLKVPVDSTRFACLPNVEPGEFEHMADTSSNPVPLPVLKTNPYFAKIYSLGWHNCDLFVNDSTAIPASVRVTVEQIDQYDEVLVGILFDELNSDIVLCNNEQGIFETFPSTRLPQVPARIFVVALQGKRWYRYENSFTVAAENVFTAALRSVSFKEINTFIKSREFIEPQLTIERCIRLQSN